MALAIHGTTIGAGCSAFLNPSQGVALGAGPCVGTLLLMCLLPAASLCAAAEFPDEIYTANLDGENGFRIDGVLDHELTGYSLNYAGDVNGDGMDDLLIGAPGHGIDDLPSGRAYLLYGGYRRQHLPVFPLTDIDESTGINIPGTEPDDEFGYSVSSAGDFNGDGIDDFLVGAPRENATGNHSGAVYLFFGSESGHPSILDPNSLDGSNGIKFFGEAEFDAAGTSVAHVGDLNGDGYDDIAIGAPGVDATSGNSGRVYVVFGTSQALPPSQDLSTINGSNGFILNGEGAHDRAGTSISHAGDVNGDGVADLMIGAPQADSASIASGRVYVVFGSTLSIPPEVNLSDLDGSNGFKLDNSIIQAETGVDVAGVGDLNFDGIDDIVIGAPSVDHSGAQDSGAAYVVFGTTSGFPEALDLSELNGSNGFRLHTSIAHARAGTSVSIIGDINNDGIDDLSIGAPGMTIDSVYGAGQVQIIYGRAIGFPPVVDLDHPEVYGGFVVNGEAESYTGRSISTAIDFGNTGVSDLAIGADAALDTSEGSTGRSYVIFGVDKLFEDDFEN